MHRESPESAGHGEGCGPVTEAMRPGKQAACESRELKATNEDINYLAGPVIRRLKADFEAHSTEAGRNAFCQAVQRLFDEFLITCIRDANFPPASINLIADLTEILPDHPSLFFYLAVALSKSGRQEEARQARDDYMARFDTDADSLRDLALLCEYTNDLKEACMLCNKALAMAKLEKRAISDPEHSTEVKQKDDLIKNLSCLLLRLEAEQKRQNFLGTAIHRWKYLGNFEWYILAKVYELQRSDAALFAFYEISRISGMEERRLKWHWRKLIKKGFLIEDGHEAKINHHIKPLIEGQQKKSLDLDMDLILFADFSETNEAVSPAKCIFNSSGEYNLYNQLIYLFPNDLIYPNMALQAIFEYDDMIRMLDKHDFEYYLKSMVDICIVATGTCSHTHWPVMGIEVDGPHHDNKVQRIRDERKNRIFDIGGVPLLRIRTDGNSAPKEVCRQLCEAIEAEVNHHWATDNAGLGVYWDTLKGALSRLSNEVA